MYTTFFGGISLYQVNRSITPASLVLNDTIPFIDAGTTLVRAAGGSTFECVLPTALPGLLGADAAFLEADGAPFYDNGVVRLDRVSGATVMGWIYGGILSQQPNFGASTASSRVFRVTLTPGQSTQCLVATTPSAATTRERPQRGRIRRRP